MENWKRRVKEAQSKYHSKEAFFVSDEATALLKEKEITIAGGKKPCLDDAAKAYVYEWCHYKDGIGTSIDFHNDNEGKMAQRFDARSIAQTIIAANKEVKKNGVNPITKALFGKHLEECPGINRKRTASAMMDSGRNGANLSGV